MKRLLLISAIWIFLCGSVFAAGSIIDRFATDAETTAQTRDDVGITPSNIPSIMAAPGTVGKFQLDHNVETLNADRTVLITDTPIQRLDANGTDRNVLMPPEASNSTDLVFFIYNMSGELGEDLNVQDDASADLATIHFHHFGICTCDGTTWVVRCISCTESTDTLNLRVKEENISAIVTGQACYISGATGVAFPTVGLADSDDSSKIRVAGLAAEDISQNTTGYLRIKGLLEDANSTKGSPVNPLSQDWTAGDQLWGSTTEGGLSNVRLAGRSIKIGTALTVEGPSSKILVNIHENQVHTGAAASEDITFQMGDSAGANKVSYTDFAGTEVGCRDSYGMVRNAGVIPATITDANVTLTSAYFGKSVRMSSASDYIAFLPSVGASDDGARLRICKTDAGKVTVDAADSDLINDSGAGKTIYNNTAAETYAFIDLEYVHAIVTWIVTGTGTWVSTN